jgi:hypothetical protein
MENQRRSFWFNNRVDFIDRLITLTLYDIVQEMITYIHRCTELNH